jgi:hypothetical protein
MSEVSPEPELTIGINIFHIQVGFLEGKILTIVDASFSDLEQRNAVKDLVKKMFREQRRHVDSIVYKTSDTTANGHILQEEESNV